MQELFPKALWRRFEVALGLAALLLVRGLAVEPRVHMVWYVCVCSPGFVTCAWALSPGLCGGGPLSLDGSLSLLH